MKRQVAVLLSLALFFLLVGCSSQNNSEVLSQEGAASSEGESSAVSESAGDAKGDADKAGASTPASHPENYEELGEAADGGRESGISGEPEGAKDSGRGSGISGGNEEPGEAADSERESGVSGEPEGAKDSGQGSSISDGCEELGEVADGGRGSGISGKSEGKKARDYMLPDSDKLVYSTSELARLSDDELFYARNELFARHGAQFEDDDLNKYFGAKEWYRAIEPKIEEFGTETLNLVEAINAATIIRIELKCGSSHVNALDSTSIEMYEAYLEKAEEYRAVYGACAKEERDGHTGLTGLCLVQLIDFEGDGIEDLLLVYHDKSLAPEEDFFNPDAYRVEVWSWHDGTLAQTQQMWAGVTQATSSYILISENGKGYEFESADSDDGGLMYYYNLSISDNSSAGDRYWDGEADISFSFQQVQTITEETLANLGASS